MSDQPKITRIDIKDYPHQPGIRVEKYADGWQANSRPYEISTQRQMSLADMSAWLKANGWQVYEWEACPVLGVPAGLRAFKGRPRSVRSRWEMRQLRQELSEKADAYLRTPESYGQVGVSLVNRVHVIDLAYEL